MDATKSQSRLTVVVEDIDVEYKVFASGKSAGAGTTSVKDLLHPKTTRRFKALKGISFEAREGESIGVIGRNGSGKSTLMRSIAGLITPVRGAVYAADRPALLGVNAALIPNLSGARNVMLGGLALGFTRAEVNDLYEKIVDFADIRDFIDQPMKTYSSGMSARLRFAIAVSKAHQVLLIDEALAVGDADFRAKSQARIKELREEAGTVFLVSHSMRSIRDVCDRVLWIDKGVLRMDGPADQVVAEYEASGAAGAGAKRKP